MLSNYLNIWLFFLSVTSLPALEKAFYYTYVSGLCISNGSNENLYDRIMLNKNKYDMISKALNLENLSTKIDHSVNESLEVKRSASRYIYGIFKNTVDKIQAEGYNFNILNLKTIEESDIVMTYSALYHKDVSNIWFDVSITPNIDDIIGADLYLHPNPLGNSYKILIYRVTWVGKIKKCLQFIDSVLVDANHKGWIKMNVTETLHNWLHTPKNNLGLYLSIMRTNEYVEDEDVDRIFELDTREIDKRPFLVGYFTSFEASNEHLVVKSRWKRSQAFSRSSNLENPYVFKGTSRHRLNIGSCRLQKLYVRFRDLEFDNFIVAPEGFEAQFCTGECRFPLNAHMNATNHAIVQTLVHFLVPGRAPQACCAPREMAHLSVLYSRDGINHMLKKYRNMIVKSCGCH